ncbi:MAG: hypothetical protein ABIN54_10800 [candidate division WOR-3 bacterium]
MAHLILVLMALPGQSQFISVFGRKTQYDGLSGIIQAPNGSFWAVGYISGFGAGDYDITLVKVDQYGNYLWAKTFGSPGYDKPVEIISTSEKFIAVCHYEFGGFSGVLLVSFDFMGNLSWAKMLSGDDIREPYSITQTFDEGFLVLSSTDKYDIALSRFDSAGNHLWSKALIPPGSDAGFRAIQTSDCGFAIVGAVWVSLYDRYAMVCRFDSTLNLLWAKILGDPRWNSANCVGETPDGSLVVAGYVDKGSTSPPRPFVAKFDLYGNLVWSKIFSDLEGEFNYLAVSNSGLILVGTIGDWPTTYLVLIYMDYAGNLLWSRLIPLGESYNKPSSLIRTLDGGYMVSGISAFLESGDNLLIKVDDGGNTCLQESLSTVPANYTPYVFQGASCSIAVIQPEVNDVELIVNTPLLRDSIICSTPLNEYVPEKSPHMFIVGREIILLLPHSGSVSLFLYDAPGRLVARPIDGFLEAGKHEVKLYNQAGLPLHPGIYFVELVAGDKILWARAVIR